MAQYETNVKIPVFSGLMQYGDGIGVDLRYAVDAKNVETPGGVLQPMAERALLTASAPKKIETLAVLHRRWYTGDDASSDVLVAAAGGVIYWMLPGGTAWTPLGHPDAVGAIKNGSWLEGVDVDWETLTAMGATIELSSDYPRNNKQTLKMALDAGETLGTIKQTITLPAPIPAPLTATLSFQYHIDADSLAAYTNGVIGEPGIHPAIITYTGVDGADEPVTAADLSSGADWSLHTKQLTIPAGATEINLMFAVATVSHAAMTVYFSDVQLLTPFASSTWSWVQYETAPATPEDDPIDVLILSNQDDGMIYIRIDDTAKTITKVTTPKNFGVIARHNERIWGGDIAEDPDMVVYSAPYDFTDWTQNSEIPADGAGDIQQPTWDGDSFTALQQLGSHLIALRRNTVWRILGTDPGEWVWKQQYGGGTAYENTIAVDGERILMLGKRGLLQYDGLSVTPYKPENLVDFWATMNIAALEQSCACLYKGKYYLSVPTGTSATNNAIVIYDTREQTWLLRTGLAVEAWLPTDSGLFFTTVSEPGCIALWGEDVWTSGTAATPCQWVSPWIDLGRKDIRKGGWQVYFTVEGKAAGTLKISLETERKLKSKTYSFSALSGHAKQKALSFGGSGRRFRLIIESTGTVAWRLVGGIQIVVEIDPD